MLKLNKKTFIKDFPVFTVINNRGLGRKGGVPLSTTPVFGISDVTQMKLEQGKPNIIHRYLRDIETAAKPA